jgi:sugar phosphate permease
MKFGKISPSRKLIPYKWELIILLWFAFFLHQADRQIFNNLAPLIMDDLSLTKVQFGFIGTIFTIIVGVTVPVAGYAGDTLPRKWVILFSILVFSMATLLTGISTGLIMLIIFRSIATSGSEAFYFPAANSLISEYHHKTRAAGMAIHQTAQYIGIVASSLAATVGRLYSWRYAFYVFGSLGIVMAGVILRRMRNTAPPGKKVEMDASYERGPTVSETIRYIFSKKTVLILSVSFAGMVFVNIGYLTWMPTFLHERFELRLDTASFLALFWHYVGAFIGVTLGGRLSDRFVHYNRNARMHFNYFGLILGAPFIWWMGQADSVILCCAALAGFGFFRGVYDSNLFAAPFDVIEPRYRSSTVGLMISCAFIMGASSPTLIALMARRLDMSAAISSMGIVYLLAGLLVILALNKTFENEYYEEVKQEAGS